MYGYHSTKHHGRRRRKKKLFLILAVGAIVLAVLVANFWTKSAEVEVIGHRWERSIEIEAYQAVDEGDWCDRLPAEAYDTRQEQRQRGTTQGSQLI